MVGGVSNIAIRNLTITNINPQIVWGGEALTIDNADRIWIDHVRVSLIGRQFFVTGFGRASRRDRATSDHILHGIPRRTTQGHGAAAANAP